MAKTGALTRAEQVYVTLRRDILAGRQQPGARLPFAELCTNYGASMGVVREALSRLTAEGLVGSEPQQGFRVMPLSIEDLKHLTEARCAVETLVLRDALKHGGVQWESQVLAAHYRLQNTAQMAADDGHRITEEWAEAHAAYHNALLSGCPNPRLLAMAQSLRDAAELYRRWSVPLGHEDRDIVGEHQAILDAILARDADAAVRVLTGHIEHTTKLLLKHIEATGTDAASA